MVDLSLFDLSGKKALVTGGAVGIGRACAIALAMGGAEVAIVGRNESIGNRTAASIRELGRDAIFVQCDVTESSQVETMVGAVVKRFGRLDIAVNNAGVFRSGTDHTHSKEDWDQVIGVNLTGTWLCSLAEMRQMIRQTPTEGKIINIASLTGSIAGISASYGAAKAGVVHLTRVLAARWGRYNINVNSISPGYVLGGIGANKSLEERQRLRELTPLGHVQRLEDLYGPILFLASRASDYITGQDLLVDGGHALSTWFVPLERTVPARIDPAKEVIELKRDLTLRGVVHDADGIILE